MTLPPQASTAPVVAAPAPPQVGTAAPGGASPALVYRGLRAQRNILDDQLNEAQGLRRQLVSDLQQQNIPPAAKASMEKRLASVDERVASLDKQIIASDQAVAAAAAVPGATIEPPRPPQNGPDPDLIAGLTFTFFLVVSIPLVIAFARRIWRRSAKVEVRLPPEMADRMANLERGVEAVALEVERIGEGQRFLTQAMAQRVEVRAVGAGEREPVAREERR